MIGEFKDYLYKEKEVKRTRQLKPSLAPKSGPDFDASDDPDGDDFVKANDSEKNYIPIEEIADSDADFSNSIDEKIRGGKDEEGKEENELITDTGKLRPSQNIQDYNYERRGSKYGNLDSFHVSHNTEELIAIASDEDTLEDKIVIKQENHEGLDGDATSLKGRGKEKRRSMTMDAWDEEDKPARKDWDNQKTKPISKIQRENRGDLRKVLDKSA